MEWTKRMESDKQLLQDLHDTYKQWLPGCKDNQTMKKETNIYNGDGKREVTRTKGVRHGFYREYEGGGEGLILGRFSNGRRVGLHWRRYAGSIWIVSNVDEAGEAEGETVIIYPDHLTVLAAWCKNGKMLEGRQAKLIGVSRQLGLPWPEVQVLMGMETFSYQPSTSSIISPTPLLRDPYEQRLVFVAPSQVPMAGEGLYARAEISEGQVLAFYNGVRIRYTRERQGDASNYRVELQPGQLDLDVPDDFVPLTSYCASLGHKACHSFTPNARFVPCDHPRFGHINSIRAMRDLRPGEEIFVHYGYKPPLAPEWFQEQWFNHVRNEGWTEFKIRSCCANSEKRWGGKLQYLPPPGVQDVEE